MVRVNAWSNWSVKERQNRAKNFKASRITDKEWAFFYTPIAKNETYSPFKCTPRLTEEGDFKLE